MLSTQGAGRRLDGGLLSVAEVAASMFQSEKWEGTVCGGVFYHTATAGLSLCRFFFRAAKVLALCFVVCGFRGNVVQCERFLEGLPGLESAGLSILQSIPPLENPPDPADIV